MTSMILTHLNGQSRDDDWKTIMLVYSSLSCKDMIGFGEGECCRHKNDIFFLLHQYIFISLVVSYKNRNDLKSQAFVSIYMLFCTPF